ncbi:hypothetical protein M0G43_14070 [Subsaxibacter sp. CAU 1640]|uniref:hypothetical protein n=1 Tax=Subsaxibacter sp. CAU 1640 TaxID=2933271 RepID=UPI0020031DD4|nr:hypothetical protein [Subsaxibacter sp. CAU 1640]MCK7591711.1 hypothetical protein [Subsaxibacter sp. CAU 1640]
MKIPWLIIALIFGGILVYYNNRKKFQINFYTSLNKTQLQEELINILELILLKHTAQSNFINTDLDNFEDLKNLIQSYSFGIKNADREKTLKLPFEFHPRGTFSELAINNFWEKDFIKISSKFNLIYSEYREKLDNPL